MVSKSLGKKRCLNSLKPISNTCVTGNSSFSLNWEYHNILFAIQRIYLVYLPLVEWHYLKRPDCVGRHQTLCLQLKVPGGKSFFLKTPWTLTCVMDKVVHRDLGPTMLGSFWLSYFTHYALVEFAINFLLFNVSNQLNLEYSSPFSNIVAYKQTRRRLCLCPLHASFFWYPSFFMINSIRLML